MPEPDLDTLSDDELDLFGKEDCDTNEEVTERSAAMPADLSLPDAVRRAPTATQQRRRGWKEDVNIAPDQPWLHEDNPAIWEGGELEDRRPTFGPSVTILGDL
jgi:hypothetical protein